MRLVSEYVQNKKSKYDDHCYEVNSFRSIHTYAHWGTGRASERRSEQERNKKWHKKLHIINYLQRTFLAIYILFCHCTEPKCIHLFNKINSTIFMFVLFCICSKPRVLSLDMCKREREKICYWAFCLRHTHTHTHHLDVACDLIWKQCACSVLSQST